MRRDKLWVVEVALRTLSYIIEAIHIHTLRRMFPDIFSACSALAFSDMRTLTESEDAWQSRSQSWILAIYGLPARSNSILTPHRRFPPCPVAYPQVPTFHNSGTRRDDSGQSELQR